MTLRRYTVVQPGEESVHSICLILTGFLILVRINLSLFMSSQCMWNFLWIARALPTAAKADFVHLARSWFWLWCCGRRQSLSTSPNPSLQCCLIHIVWVCCSTQNSRELRHTDRKRSEEPSLFFYLMPWEKASRCRQGVDRGAAFISRAGLLMLKKE